MSEKAQIKAEELKVQGSTEQQYVEIDGLKIRLAKPLEFGFKWVGNDIILNQLKSAWYSAGEGDSPMNPRLIGKPGVGKTVVAYAAAKMLELPVYFFQATSDTKPTDVLINPVIIETSKDSSRVEYVASPLVSAMIVGGVIVFDEGNRMQEKAWAALAPLLDSRRYIESVVAGIIINAHPDFRFVSTMNDDASCFELPEYIKSRLQPQIFVGAPERKEYRRILDANLTHTSPVILDYVADFLHNALLNDEDYSVREGIHIAHYAGKLMHFEQASGREISAGDACLKAVEQILGVKQTRYIKQVLWKEQDVA